MSTQKVWNRWMAVICVVGPVMCATQGSAQNRFGEDQAFFVTFQVQGSTNTSPVSINNAGKVAGYYAKATDAYQTFHGFLREPLGAIITFDVAGSISTQPVDMNAGGAIAGQYRDASGKNHGFVRSARGVITQFDVTGPNVSDTFPTSINDAGAITGSYGPAGGQQPHGFVRDSSGTITTFDVPNSLQTTPRGINAAGAVVGYFADTTDVEHGFVRDPSGTITSIQPPDFRQAAAWSVNTKGTIVGVYSITGAFSAFIRATDGTFTSFAPPANGQIDTDPQINAAGIVAGFYLDANSVIHGFVRTPDGVFTPIDVLGADFTSASGINDFGVVTGGYSIGNTSLGFVRVPVGNDRFQPGTYGVSDEESLNIDGGFYLYGEPTVRLWPFVTGNPSQHWHFGEVPGGFTLLNLGTGQYASDRSGNLFESGHKEVWSVTPVPGGYSIKNNRTGLYLTDPAVQRGPVTLTPGGSVWEFSAPK